MGRTGADRVRRYYSVVEMAQNAEKVYAEMLARPVRA
jgi:hypothetical protein